MSASEKLKALDAKAVGPQTYCPEPQQWNEVAEDVVAALPQIVAVVEAAELHVVTSAGHLHAIGLDVFDRALRDALAALDEALS